MSTVRGLMALALILGIIACALAGMSWWKIQGHVSELRGQEQSPGVEGKETMTVQGAAGWLQGKMEDKINQVEKQLRGLDMTMVEVATALQSSISPGRIATENTPSTRERK